ncbi:hypothetical protein CWS02_05690 [Enterobacter sp. EA-1]|nr:hypothetical protein CWS02_05690 [Enterobacter sp. EA-1]
MMIQAYGMHNALSLWQTVNAVVDHGDMPLLALCVTVLLVSAPFMQLFLLLRVLLLLHGNHHVADVAFTIKALRWVRPWCMADVAILGFCGLRREALLAICRGSRSGRMGAGHCRRALYCAGESASPPLLAAAFPANTGSLT